MAQRPHRRWIGSSLRSWLLGKHWPMSRCQSTSTTRRYLWYARWSVSCNRSMRCDVCDEIECFVRMKTRVADVVADSRMQGQMIDSIHKNHRDWRHWMTTREKRKKNVTLLFFFVECSGVTEDDDCCCCCCCCEYPRVYDEWLGFCIGCWSKLVAVGTIGDCIVNDERLELSCESFVESAGSGWTRPPPSFHEARFAGRKIGPCVVELETAFINESDDDLPVLLSCVTKRGKSFNPNRFGGWSLGLPPMLPAVTWLQLAGPRGLSISDEREDETCVSDDDGGGVEAWAGSESSCCWVGCFDGVNGRVGVWLPVPDHPWLVPLDGITGSNDAVLPPVSLFRLGRFAGGGIRRLLIFPRLAHPCEGAAKEEEEYLSQIDDASDRLTRSSTSFVGSCLVYEIIGFDTSITFIFIDRFTRNRHDNGLTSDFDVAIMRDRNREAEWRTRESIVDDDKE